MKKIFFKIKSIFNKNECLKDEKVIHIRKVQEEPIIYFDPPPFFDNSEFKDFNSKRVLND